MGVKCLSCRLALTLTLLLLGACSLLGQSGREFALLTTHSSPQPRIAQQQWQLQQGDSRYALEVVAELYPDRWQLILLNNLGQRLATVTAEAGVVHTRRDQSHPAMALLPALVQAWQFSYWPLTDLQAADSRWLFSEAGGHREVRFSGILRAAIAYQSTSSGANPWQGSLRYETREFHLHIHSQLLN